MTYYHRTVFHAASITHSVIGNFLDEEKEDIIVTNGRILKLLRYEIADTSPAIQTLISCDIYDIIVSLSKFRCKNETKDLIVISTDSGNTAILSVNAEKKEFEVVVQQKFKVETLKTPQLCLQLQHLAVDPERILTESSLQDEFKDKISRTLPVQHMAVDTEGRVIFIAAMEEVKRFYTFFGPDIRCFGILDADEKNTLIYDIAFVDIKEKIIVAYLVTTYKESDPQLKYFKKRQKPSLVFAEMDKDKVTEIKRMYCRDFAHSLISVPGERGVLVCAGDFIAFYSLDSSSIIRCSIPIRIMDPKPGVVFVCSTKCSEKLFNCPGPSEANVSNASSTQKYIYYLAQTEQGDIFRIQLVVKDHGVNEIILKYFITLPVASALCTFESGFLFVASEFGDHHIYKIADIENCAKVHPSFSSALKRPGEFEVNRKPFLFLHRILENIAPIAEIKSMSPIMQMEFEPLSSTRPRMCLALGRASLSSLKISKLEQDQFSICYQLCAKMEKEEDEIPLRMWAVKSTESISKDLDTLIVVSFDASTAVYSLQRISECVAEKIEGTKFATETNTVGCAKTGKDAIVQVCPEGVCLITGGKNMLVYETKEKDAIAECAMNKKSLVIALNNELMHHKINEDGLVIKSKIPSRLINGPVTCMLLSEKSESDQLLAVGISTRKTEDEVTVRVNEVHLFIIGLSGINLLSMLKVENSPYSFIFMNGGSNLQPLLVGCENGILLTLAVEETAETDGTIKHELNKLKTKKCEEIGSEAVQLLLAHVRGESGVLVVSNHSWFMWLDNFGEYVAGDFSLLKSNIPPCFCNVPESEEIVTISEDELRVFVLEDLPPKPSVSYDLEYTPKKFIIDSDTGNIFIIETENNSYTKETQEKKETEFKKDLEATKSQKPASNLPFWKQSANPFGWSSLLFGPSSNLLDRKSAVKKIPKSWASLLRVINVTDENVSDVFKSSFDQNVAALSLCLLKQDVNDLLLVGVAENFRLNTKCCDKASIYTYKISKKGETMCLLHKTDLRSAPLAMCCYEGNVLIGTGRKLALYCVTPESLELICEKKDCVSSSITAIYPVDERILVSDSDFGISYVMFMPRNDNSGSLYLLKADVFPSEVTTACILSGNQMARATKSREIFIVELGILEVRDMSKVYNDDEPPFTISKEELLGCFHVGELVTSMQLCTISYEPDTVLYTTLSGSVGALSWIPWKKEAEFLNSLYTTLQKQAKEVDKKRSNLPIYPNLKFRSRHYKCQNVIDGDFLDEFLKLDVESQKSICDEIKEGNVTQISTRLNRIRREKMFDFQF